MSHDLSVNGLASAAQKHFKLATPADTRQQERFLNKLSGYVNFMGQIRGTNDEMYMKIKNEMGGGRLGVQLQEKSRLE